MKLIQILVVLSISFIAGRCFADTVVVNDGDSLVGKFQTPYIGIETPYQNLFFNLAFISEINMESALADQYAVITINNDIFRGKLINPQVETVISSGEHVALPADTVRNIRIDDIGETKELETTVFFINNGDRFSGKLMTTSLAITTGQFPLIVKRENIARIVFTQSGTRSAELYLVDGSRLVGEIQEAFLSVAPDSAPPINICTVNFASIQFNALKYIKKIISPDNYTDPDTKTPRYLALFPAVTVDITNSGANCESRLSPEVAIDDDFEALKLTTILFDTDKSDIKPEFYQKLNRISEFLKKHPSIVLQIKGHTDIRGTADYNQELSLRRGASVGYFMEKTGVDSGRIQISGYGLTQPVADNQTDEGKSKNRRVDLVLVP